MSSKSTPINRFNKSIIQRDSTPKVKGRAINVSKSGNEKTIYRNHHLDESVNDNSLLNVAFSQSNLSTSSGNKTPKSLSKLSSKSKSSSSLNMAYTPSSLYKTSSINWSNSKSLFNTPQSGRKALSNDNNTPDSLYKNTPRRCKTNTFPNLDETSKSITTCNKNDPHSEVTNLTVAVRVRPLIFKELTSPTLTNVVRINRDNEVTVLAGNTADNSAGVSHTFQYDKAYWSCNPENENYASQNDVFEGVAIPLLDKAFEGYNACLFAYGQTGSGKSYSMMGIDADIDNFDTNSEAGIIPRFCHELFHRINILKDKIHAEVEVNYLEIYNEKIHDLLAVSMTEGLINTVNCQKKRPVLRIRDHPVWGPYVVDLSTHPVDSHQALRNWLAVGNTQRATAATGSNDKSSRSHAIFNIVLNLSEINNDFDQKSIKQTKRSKISLVDLAGSERISNTCASGERLREGVCINKSLLTLGKVIAALADSKTTYIPYRDSELTRLLRENLGGNSRTIMLATISPASCHLDETLSTLRYACQARTIINRIKVNEAPHDRIIRELREEVERLQALRQDYERQQSRNSISNSLQHQQPYVITVENKTTEIIIDDKQVDELKQQLYASEQELAKAEKSWMERLKEAKELQKTEMNLLKRKGLALEMCIEQKYPCLVNLAADPMLSGTLLYLVPPGIVKIGKSSSKAIKQPDIVLDGPLVAVNHCSIENRNNKELFIKSENNEFETYINGELLNTIKQLYHGDRLVIGGLHYFRISNQFCKLFNKNNKLIDYQLAHQEILAEQETLLRKEFNDEKEIELKKIENERIKNELSIKKQWAKLELEKFKYNYSNEILEIEKKNFENQQQIHDVNQYKSIDKTKIFENLKKLMEHPTKESLHETKMLVKEATQRCNDLNINIKFLYTQKPNEFGIFNTIIYIVDNVNKLKAEWTPARLNVWLNKIRNNDDFDKENVFNTFDIKWTEYDNLNNSILNCNLNDTLNNSFTSNRLSLNLNEVKDLILGECGNNLENRKKSPNRRENLHKYNDDMDDSIINVTPRKCDKNSLIDKSVSINTIPFEQQAKYCLKDIQHDVRKFKNICVQQLEQQRQDNRQNDLFLENFMQSINKIETMVQHMSTCLYDQTLPNYNIRTPKSVRFLLE